MIHLLTNGKTETQEEINLRLLEKYYPNRNQLTLFESMIDDKELLNTDSRYYAMQNGKVSDRAYLVISLPDAPVNDRYYKFVAIIFAVNN